MKPILFFLFLAAQVPPGWFEKSEKAYKIFYRDADRDFIRDYNRVFKIGKKDVEGFFSTSFRKPFSIYVHPSRSSLDSTWQKDWSLPEFKSECWMVASGISGRVDLISPIQWKNQSCEHNYDDKAATQKLITHELVHVFHAQVNAGKDFDNLENLDWFVEGLAAYASGQVTKEKIQSVKIAIEEKKIPASLDDFWKGRIRYQLSGSIIQYIDQKWGRKKLKALMTFTKKSEVLANLGITEADLLNAWEEWMKRI
jgi:hypothetical protein